MEITEEEIKHVAALSRFEFRDKELDQFTSQMGRIIEMAEQLGEANTEGVPETTQVVDRGTVYREDKSEHWQDRKEMLKNVPEISDDSIKVPVIIDKDDND